MKKQNEQPCGWICVEKQTNACDGIYTEKASAEYQCGRKNTVWEGSQWDLEPVFRGYGMIENYHRDEPMRNELISWYGKPNYKAADEYDRAHGRI